MTSLESETGPSLARKWGGTKEKNTALCFFPSPKAWVHGLL